MLTVYKVKHAKPGKHTDHRGLYLLVRPTGAKFWLLRVQYQGRRREFGLGSVWDVKIADLVSGAAIRTRAIVIQQKTGRPGSSK
jgi:hypothetical protein